MASPEKWKQAAQAGWSGSGVSCSAFKPRFSPRDRTGQRHPDPTAGSLWKRYLNNMTRAVFVLIGCLLLSTAVAKLWMLLTDPFADLKTGTSISLLWAAVFVELAVVWVLASRATGESKWLVLLVFFSSMTAVSTYNLLSGRLTCGCAGSFPLHPAWVLGFDVLVVVILLLCKSLRLLNYRLIVRESAETFGGTASAALTVAIAVILWQSPRVKSLVQASLGELDVSAEVSGQNNDDASFSARIHLCNRTDRPVEIIAIGKSCYCVNLAGDQRTVPAHGTVRFNATIERSRQAPESGAQRLVFYLDAPRQRVLPVNLFYDWR